MYQQRSLSIEVRDEMTSSLYVMIHHFKDKDLGDLRRIMTKEQRELVDSLVENYDKDYRYKK